MSDKEATTDPINNDDLITIVRTLATKVDLVVADVSLMRDKIDLIASIITGQSGDIGSLEAEVLRNKKKLEEMPILSRFSKRKSRNFWKKQKQAELLLSNASVFLKEQTE